MRKLVLKMSISVDGFVAGPNGEIDWIFRTSTPGSAGWVLETLQGAGMHVMGSKTFHDMAHYWPTSSDQFAAPMNDLPKVVFSRKGGAAPVTGETTRAIKDARKWDASQGIAPIDIEQKLISWKEAAVETDLTAGIQKLKQQDGKFILAHGGASFAQDLVKFGLIDEFRLVIHPVVLGKGLPLFAGSLHPFDLTLESSTSFPGGIIANIYRKV